MTIQHRKRCAKCLKLRPLEEFEPHQNRGRWCRTCYRGYFKEFNRRRYGSPEGKARELERGKIKYATNVRSMRMERKRKLIMLMGGKCNLCGYAKSAAALDFDHLENGRTVLTKRGQPCPSKNRTISHLLAMNTAEAFDLAVEESKKCRLICANCHREQTFPGHELNENQK